MGDRYPSVARLHQLLDKRKCLDDSQLFGSSLLREALHYNERVEQRVTSSLGSLHLYHTPSGYFTRIRTLQRSTRPDYNPVVSHWTVLAAKSFGGSLWLSEYTSSEGYHVSHRVILWVANLLGMPQGGVLGPMGHGKPQIYLTMA